MLLTAAKFASTFFREVDNPLNVSQHMSAAFHPQTERQKCLDSMSDLVMMTGGTGLPCCDFAINNAFQEPVRKTDHIF